LRNPRLKKKAITAEEKIGKVRVEHGKTGCKPTDAAQYLRKAAARGRHGC